MAMSAEKEDTKGGTLKGLQAAFFCVCVTHKRQIISLTLFLFISACPAKNCQPVQGVPTFSP